MFIIAEVGSNIKSLDDCLYSARITKKCGADAVKFQYFNKQDLYGSIIRYFNDETIFRSNWFDEIKKFCDGIGIKFMCSAFSEHGYDLVNQYVDLHKIASCELTAVDLLKKVNSFKKPVYLSTAGSSFKEIEDALYVLKDCKVTLFWCVGDYPAKIVDFQDYEQMLAAFPDHEVGFSDHSIDVLNIPMFARSLGCKTFEKHVNFLEYDDTPDSHHALNEVEFSIMIKNLKGQSFVKPDEAIKRHKRIYSVSDKKWVRPFFIK